jgi:hypothetical protein
MIQLTMYLYIVSVFNFQQEVPVLSSDFLIRHLCEIISKKNKKNIELPLT